MTEQCLLRIKRYINNCRGISSTVRRCIEKETGTEYAAKIIDISNETNEDGHTMKDGTLQEVQILRRVAGHPYISKFENFRNNYALLVIFILPEKHAMKILY